MGYMKTCKSKLNGGK